MWLRNGLWCHSYETVYTVNKVVCMKHHSYLQTGCYPPVTIETRTSFLSSIYRGCSPPVTIETRTLFLVVPSTQAVSHLLLTNKGKAGKILAMHWLLPKIQGLVGYTVHLQLGCHAWDLYTVYYNQSFFFSMKVEGRQDSIANEKHLSYKITKQTR